MALPIFGSRGAQRTPFYPFLDMLFNCLLGITIMFIVAVVLLTPTNKKGIIDPKAEYIITITWPDNNPNDIDTWVEDPSGGLLWFRNRESGLIHLDRDDRGMLNDVLNINGREIANPLNQEVTTIRGIVVGEYVVNVHYYATEDSQPVSVTVRLDRVNPALEVLYYETITVTQKGEEQTAFRFTINEDGSVSNISKLPKSLVTFESNT